MSTFYKYLFLMLLAMGSQRAAAQWGQVCVDSNRIQPFYSCVRPEFTPVCGCNNVTYRNDCVAFNNFGVNNWTDGVCFGELFFFDFWPNIVNDQLAFYLKFSVKSAATVEIVDAFGKIMFYRIFNSVPEPYYFETYYVGEYKPGVYFISVRSGKKMSVKKFIKT